MSNPNTIISIQPFETSEEVELKKTNIVKNIGFSLLIIISLPLTICDLYFGTSNDKCLDEYPHDIHLNMKTYLMVSGILSLFGIFIMLINISVNVQKEGEFVCMLILNIMFSLFAGLFTIIWTIMGSIVFWGFVFPKHNCSYEVSNYLFASIIIRLVFIYINFANVSNIKKNE